MTRPRPWHWNKGRDLGCLEQSIPGALMQGLEAGATDRPVWAESGPRGWDQRGSWGPSVGGPTSILGIPLHSRVRGQGDVVRSDVASVLRGEGGRAHRGGRRRPGNPGVWTQPRYLSTQLVCLRLEVWIVGRVRTYGESSLEEMFLGRFWSSLTNSRDGLISIKRVPVWGSLARGACATVQLHHCQLRGFGQVF